MQLFRVVAHRLCWWYNRRSSFYPPSDCSRRDISNKNRKKALGNKALTQILRGMPNQDTHLRDLRKMRGEKRSRKSFGNVPHYVHFQAVGHGSPGGCRALLLYTENHRYLFNCGEGTQRLCHEYCGSRTLAQLSQIFITRRTWDNLGGLPGMCLSIRAAGAPDVTVHGPPGTMDMYEATKRFIVLHDFDVIGQTAEERDAYEDSAVIIRHVPLISKAAELVRPKKPKHTLWLPDTSPSQTRSGEFLKVASAHHLKFVDPSVSGDPIDQTVNSYVITCKAKPGKLLIDKCIQMGVKPGPLLGELKAGRNVHLDDGRVVRSHDVMEDAAEPLMYWVIDCPTPDYLPSLLEKMDVTRDEVAAKLLRGVFHFTPTHVVDSQPYRKWLESLPTGVQNVTINDANKGYGSYDTLVFNKMLNIINPVVFPPIFANRSCSVADNGNIDKKNTSTIPGMKLAQKIHVRPSAGICENFLEDIDAVAVEKEVKKINGAEEAISRVHSAIEVLKKEEERDGSPKSAERSEYPKVTFLGTGSSVPSKYRCVSGILIQNEANKYMLMDCGEGISLQLHRLYGREGTRRILKCLTSIYISHLHADHHLGVIEIVRQRELAFHPEEPSKMYLIAPARLADFLSLYHQKFESVLTDLCLIRCEHLLPFCFPNEGTDDEVSTSPTTTTQKLFNSVQKEVFEYVGLKSLWTSRAVHCPSSFCVAVTFAENNYKIVYTGDTRPNDDLIKLGTNEQATDLLIHEATMEHYMLSDCKHKKHSTFVEAVEDGKRMKAKFTLLTHFSQRYAKLPVFDGIEDEENVAFAWDFMTVSPQTLPFIRASYPAMKLVFHDALQEMLERKEDFKYKNTADIVAASLSEETGGPIGKKIKLEDLL